MKKVSLVFILFLLIFMSATPLLAADKLVPPTYPTIQDAIDAAQAGDVVKVAKGTYQENVVMKEGVALQGGYSADFSVRDVFLYVTTIDGGKNGSVVLFENILSASIEGFTITNGESDFGGGINCEESNPRILNNTIKGNHATGDGGGIRCYKSNPTIANNAITGNSAKYGGGILCYESSPDISNNTITNNKAGTDGGGIECYDQSNPTISSNTITNNKAGGDGGGIECYDQSNPTISSNTITNNKAGGDGGGIDCYNQSNPRILSNTISVNKAAGNGGGVYCYESSPEISNNTISGNKSEKKGGGIRCYKSNPTIANSTVTGNSAEYGGGIHCYESNPKISNVIISGNYAFLYGGAVYCSSSSPVFTNCAIVRNSAAEYGALYVSSSSPQISNTIFWQNDNDLIFDFTSTPSVTYSDIADARFSGQNGNMSTDPLFADIEAGDYRLGSGSPCINAGNPSADEKNPDGSRNDMGAFGGPGDAAWGTDIPMIPVPYKEESHWADLGLYGGQIVSLAIDPINSSKIFAASWNGDGFFVTINGGATWQTVEGFRNNDCYWVAIDPLDHSVWLTYNHFVALSVDGGTSWSKWRLSDGRFAYSVAIDPTDSNTIYVGAGGAESSGLKGAVFKTKDGGKTWTQSSLEADKSVTFLAINPSNHKEVWALTGRNESGSVYKSSDGGGAWEKVDIGYADDKIRKMIIHPEKPLTIYISGDFGVIKTLDGGETWEGAGITEACNGLTMDPGNPNVIYASTWYVGGNNYLYKSHDGGTTWDKYEIDFNSFMCISVDPRDSNNVYGGDPELGVLKSLDMGATWGAINQGIRANIVRDSTVDPNDRGTVLVGTQAGLFKKEKDGEWNTLIYENAYSIAYDPQDSNTVYAGQAWDLARTTDYGKTWEKTDISSSSNLHRVSCIAVDSRESRVLYLGVYYYLGNRGEIYKSSDGGKTLNLMKVFDRPVNTLKIDPANPQVIYAGTGMFYASSYDQQGGVYKSSNRGATWTGPMLKDVVVNSIEIDAVNSNVLYAGCGESGKDYDGLYKSVDGGLTWEKKDFDPGVITEIKINPNRTSTLYASTYRRGVYISIDSGENWTNMGLSDYKMFDLSLSETAPASFLKHPFRQTQSSRTLYAGTNSGISAFTGSSISGWIYNSAGTANIYPAQVWLDVGQGQYHADVFDTGSYLILNPPVGNDYDLFCSAEGYGQTRDSGISVGAMSDVTCNFFLEASEVPVAPVLTVTTSGTKVTVSWTSVATATGYTLFYAPYPYTGPDSIRSIDMGSQTGISVVLRKGASFYIAVTAYNSVSVSGYSNIAHFVVQ